MHYVELFVIAGLVANPLLFEFILLSDLVNRLTPFNRFCDRFVPFVYYASLVILAI